MAEGNSGGWVGQLIGAIVIALVAGGSSPWWWSELKRAWQPDAPPAASSPVAPASAAAPVAPVRAASTASAPTVTPAVAPASAPPTTPEPNPEAYRAVQRIYERTKGVSDCAALADSIKNLQRYTRGQRLVPEEFSQTVIYPKRMVQPTIADLAIDRISRVKLASPSCFP